MQKSIFSAVVFFLAVIAMPFQSYAGILTENNPIATSDMKPVENKQAQALLSRLDEIKTMNKSELSFKEKRELRKEVRAAKKQLRAISGGVYLSTGAIIIIVLLLILLL